MGSKFKGDEVKLCEADGLGFEFAVRNTKCKKFIARSELLNKQDIS